MLTLYYSPGSSSMATHIALNEVGAPFELKLTALHRQENRTAEYLAVNPEGKVPALVIDGRPPLTEVAATLWYLARRYPEAGSVAAIRRYRGRGANHLVDVVYRRDNPPGPPRRGRALARGLSSRRTRGSGRTNGRWSRYSIADIHLFRLYWRFVKTLEPPLDAYPNLTAHYDRMMARPGGATHDRSRGGGRLQPAALIRPGRAGRS